MTDEIKGLVTRLKESAEAFRKYPIFTADGDPVFLKVQADELTEAAAALTLSDEARVRAESRSDSHFVRKAKADAAKQHARAQASEALVRELVEGLRRGTSLLDSYGDPGDDREFIATREAMRALILSAGNLGSSSAESAALLAPQASGSAAQSLDGGEG